MATFAMPREESEQHEAGCSRIDRIAADFHDLLIAHCPLCNNVGPECIVETLNEAIAADEAADEDEDLASPLVLAARRAQ
jgi:hypothetical protein